MTIITEAALTDESEYTLAKIDLLAPLSPLATRLIEQLSDEFVNIRDVVDVVCQDPGVSARLLGLANSALYQMQQPVLTVEDAIIKVLGLDTTRAVVLGIAFRGSLGTAGCRGLDQQQLWTDTLTVANLTSLLVKANPSLRDHAPTAYVGALFANLGILALATVEPERLDRCFGYDDLVELEDLIRLEFKCGHRQVGAQLVSQWGLPGLFGAMIRRQKQPEEPITNQLIEHILLAHRVSDFLADPEPDQALLLADAQQLGIAVENFERMVDGAKVRAGAEQIATNIVAAARG